MAAPTTTVKTADPVKPIRKPRKPVDPNETKADKFKRLAVHRTTRAVKYTRAIASLANKSQYESTDEQIAKILSALQDAVNHVKTVFSGKQTADDSFKL